MSWKTTDTKEKLLDAARAEFSRYGYADASLRRIAATVGIAAPSVYNHFSSKAEMFSALVDPVIHKVLETFHATDEQKQNALNQHETDRAFEKDNTMHPVLNFVFENLEDVKLLLFCSLGTKYENILDKAAKMESDATWRMMEEAGYPPMSEQDKETLFLLMRHQYQTYAEAIRLDFSKERTAEYWKAIRDFYDAGWHKFLNS